MKINASKAKLGQAGEGSCFSAGKLMGRISLRFDVLEKFPSDRRATMGILSSVTRDTDSVLSVFGMRGPQSGRRAGAQLRRVSQEAHEMRVEIEAGTTKINIRKRIARLKTLVDGAEEAILKERCQRPS